MDKSFCFFFQKEVLSSCLCVGLKTAWYKGLHEEREDREEESI
jgi:hypothetical protein